MIPVFEFPMRNYPDKVEEQMKLFYQEQTSWERKKIEEMYAMFGWETNIVDLVDEPVIIESNKDNVPYELERVEDITHETEDDESLSIEKKEKELIIKALHKNSNKRKYAAQDLGISLEGIFRLNRL